MFSFLYKHIFKPLAFAQDPERVHDSITAMGELLGKFSLTRQMTRKMFAFEDPRLESEIAGIKFKNPIGLAAGFDKNAHLLDILPYVGFGFAEIGSVTAKPSSGNPKPRLWRLPDSEALVVNYGLMNDGVDVVLERVRESRVIRYRALNNASSRAEASEAWRSQMSKIGRMRLSARGGSASGMTSSKAPRNDNNEVQRLAQDDSVLRNFRIGISVAKTNCKDTADEAAGIADYFECFQKVNESGLADYITINVSCPNAYGGEPFTTPDKFERLTAKLKEIQWSVPVFVKLPCDYTDADQRGLNPSSRTEFTTGHSADQRGLSMRDFEGMLDVAVKYGYSGVILSNLTKDRINNPIIQKSDLSKIGKGGISGKPTFERSNNLIKHAREYLDSSCTVETRDLVSLPRFAIIGCGGVFSGEDAKTKLDAGADLIQMITGMIYQGPQVVGEMNRYLATHSL